MSCELCDDTGWKPVDERTGIRRVVRCDVLARAGGGSIASPPRTSRSAISTARSSNFSAYNPSLESARSSRRDAYPTVSVGQQPPRAGSRAAARRLARRRQDAPRRRRPEAGDELVARARPVLRHARSAARHPQHLRSVDPDHRARGAAAGDDARICWCSTIWAPRRRRSGSRRR